MPRPRLPPALQERERANVLDDTSMTSRERQLNMRLLQHAAVIAKDPRQRAVQLYT